MLRRKPSRPEGVIDSPPRSELEESKLPNPRPKIPPSARLVSEVRSELGVTLEFFARMTGFSVRVISGWKARRPCGGSRR